MPHENPLGERPDEHEAIIEAVEVAASRGLPLAADIAPNASGSTPVSTQSSALPRKTPWSDLPKDAVQGVDIMRTLIAISPRMASVEEEIERLITTPIKLIADIASHTLNAGGKRLRPALTLIAAQLCGDDGESPNARVVTCAAAIELTHTTTLLHDDVVDSAEVRRGKPAANLLWGNGMSVLVGDYLFAQVFLIASQRGFYELMNPLAQATAQMCAGELLEAQKRGELQMDENDYGDIQHRHALRYWFRDGVRWASG